ncbi:MAG TPA: tRNA (adenosine(37)-N6)-threonylcarbamoyltransferase complex transferase subunit TsaD, partial [Patescibacteria group bacterium]|nr:tRNA (adenosine(37)-N6)-threonylcarbamoyltransferase complex transferase subunit TsaD [Patescibacteria group bacterium]
LDRKGYNFSFSGLKTAVLYKVKELQSQRITINHYQSLVAHEFQQTVIDILIGKTVQAAYEYRPKSICLCGGVAANRELRQQMAKAVSCLPHHPSFHIPSLKLSTDNAAMIGIAAAYQSPKKYTTYKNINADANLGLPDNSSNIRKI